MLNDVLNVISTVGFPIAMCVFLCWYVKDSTEKNREEVNKINADHKEEVANITTALENNTIALTKLCERIGGDSIG